MTTTAWTPDNISSAIGLWLDSSDSSTLTIVNGQVSKWASKVGYLFVEQADTSKQPTWSAQGRNSKAAVSFNGKQYLTMNSLNSGGVAALPAGGSAGSLALIGYLSAAGSYPNMLNYGNAAAGRQRCIMSLYGSHTVGASLYNYDKSSGVNWSDDRIVVATFATGNLSLSVDGKAISSFSDAKPNTSAALGAVGANPNGSNAITGDIQEAFIFTRALTPDEQARLEGYLAWKWGKVNNLAPAHPYKNGAPLMASISFSQYAPLEAASYTTSFFEDFSSPISIRPEAVNPTSGVWNQQYWYGWPGYYSCHNDYAANVMVSKAWTKGKYDVHVQNDSIMHLLSVPLPAGGDANIYGDKKYAGAILTTDGYFQQRYGYFECRCAAPTLPGSWPCFWLWSLKDSGELDIFECNTGDLNMAYFSTHQRMQPDGKGGYTQLPQQIDTNCGLDLKLMPNYKLSDWHVYGFLWTNEKMVWYIDGIAVRTVTGHNFHEEAFIILTNGMGGWSSNNANPQFPCDFQVDYVRVGKPV